MIQINMTEDKCKRSYENILSLIFHAKFTIPSNLSSTVVIPQSGNFIIDTRLLMTMYGIY